ncbi:hypothetical protein [Ekhidna sp.]|uniref:hypothetical protein n=1 Tax=Ekhidna sp. TaxID=2608089 RepID=UPI003CCC0515
MAEEPSLHTFPIIATLAPFEVNQETITLNGEITKEGIDKIDSVGFVWTMKEFNSDSFSIIREYIPNQFNRTIDSSFHEGFSYSIRAFARSNNRFIYGNEIEIISKGTNKSSWTLELGQTVIDGYGSSFGISDSRYGYVLVQSGEMYIFDPFTKVLSYENKFPFGGDTGTRITSIEHNGILYFMSNNSRNLYTYANGGFKIKSQMPFNYSRYGNYYHGHAHDNKIYILNSHQSYSYDLEMDEWKRISSISESSSYGGVSLGKDAFIICYDKSIWKFNPESNIWSKVATYPGKIDGLEPFVSFSYDRRIYFGLHGGETDLWSYDLVDEIWNRKRFPLKAIIEPAFFKLENKLYILNSGNKTKIISYDLANSSN